MARLIVTVTQSFSPPALFTITTVPAATFAERCQAVLEAWSGITGVWFGNQEILTTAANETDETIRVVHPAHEEHDVFFSWEFKS
jgi:hypothetical protein